MRPKGKAPPVKGGQCCTTDSKLLFPPFAIPAAKLGVRTKRGQAPGTAVTAADRQVLAPRGAHIFANAPTFRSTVPTVPPFSWLPMRFGRITQSVKPYSVSLPLSLRRLYGAKRYSTKRSSRVSYQLLRNVAPLSLQSPSLPAPRRFPQPDVP